LDIREGASIARSLGFLVGSFAPLGDTLLAKAIRRSIGDLARWAWSPKQAKAAGR